jgi:lysophospholipase L1-like esterase
VDLSPRARPGTPLGTLPGNLPGNLLGATLATLLVLLLAGCTSTGTPAHPSGGSGSAPSTRAGGGYQRYVALGDSYSAGPLIPTTDLAGGCARSDHNYPSVLAGRLHVGRFVDVTCSGATTGDLTHVQHPFRGARVPPQLHAVTRRTDLVTLGIGGNDLDLFETLVSTCTRLRSSDPSGSPCGRELARRGPDLHAATATISARVAGALRDVHRRAPKATVLLVGYLRLVPDRGTCAGLPLAVGDYPVGRRISQALNRALSRAASRAGALYVDMYAASTGHDICSAHPWVNGGVTDRTRALAYHPVAAGMRADAAEVLATLRRSPGGVRR